MAGIELASAFVSLIPDARGISEKVSGALNKPMDEASKTFGQKLSSIASKVTEAVGVGAAAVVAISIKNADALNESQDQLANAIKNTGGAYDKQAGAIKAAQKTGENLGFTYVQTNDALRTLTTGTGSSTKALALLAVTQDLARAKGIDLSTAAIAVAKASEGQLRPLKQLGIDLPVAAGGALKVQLAQVGLVKAQVAYNTALTAYDPKAKNHAKLLLAVQKAHEGLTAAQAKLNVVQNTGASIVDALSTRLKGTALTATQSLQGKVELLRTKFTDITAKIGQDLIPILLRLVGVIGNVINWFQKNKIALDALLIVVGLFIAGMVAMAIIAKVTAFVRLMSAAWAILNAVIAANPIVAVIAVIALLVVGIIYAYNHFAFFHNAIQQVWDILQSTFSWLQSNWPLVLAILTGPFGVAALLIIKNWGTITTFFQNIPGEIVGFFSNIGSDFLTIGGDIISGIVNGIKNAAGLVLGAIKGVLHSIPGAGLLSNVPGIGGLFKAKGGPVSGGRPYIVGERGPELFVPGQSGTIATASQTAAGLNGRGGFSVAGDLNITTNTTHDALAELSWLAYTA